MSATTRENFLGPSFKRRATLAAYPAVKIVASTAAADHGRAGDQICISNTLRIGPTLRVFCAFVER